MQLFIWTQAAVHASQQKSPQKGHTMELLARKWANMLEIVTIPYCIAQVKKSEYPSGVIYKQNFLSLIYLTSQRLPEASILHRDHLIKMCNIMKSPYQWLCPISPTLQTQFSLKAFFQTAESERNLIHTVSERLPLWLAQTHFLTAAHLR